MHFHFEAPDGTPIAFGVVTFKDGSTGTLDAKGSITSEKIVVAVYLNGVKVFGKEQ